MRENLAGLVVEQLLDEDRRLAVLRELRPVAGHGRVQVQLAALGEVAFELGQHLDEPGFVRTVDRH